MAHQNWGSGREELFFLFSPRWLIFWLKPNKNRFLFSYLVGVQTYFDLSGKINRFREKQGNQLVTISASTRSITKFQSVLTSKRLTFQ